MRNIILKRVLVILLCVICVALIILLAVKVLINSNSLNYNLGDIDVYSDTVLYSYDDYNKFVKYYKIRKDLTKSDFQNNTYIASFQDFDKCSEKSLKKVTGTQVQNDKINISFDVSNKCGMCKSEIIVYLIKMDKIPEKAYEIQSIYKYEKQLKCGTI